MKTHSGAKKRFRTTASGKIKIKKPGSRHLNYGKGQSRLRRLDQNSYVDATQEKGLKRIIPYGVG
jgi:large subunit ribosomal protein L35